MHLLRAFSLVIRFVFRPLVMIRFPHKAVHAARVQVRSRDLAARVDALWIGVDSARARGVERSDGSVGIAHEAVSPEVHVRVRPRNIAAWVDARRYGARRLSRLSSTRYLERCNGTIWSPQEATRHIAVV